MKRYNRLMFVGVTLAALLFSGACTDLLKEQPRAQYTPDFFETATGVENGVTSLYAHLRYIYGQYFYAFTENGTDEYTIGESRDQGNNGVPDMFFGDPIDYDNDRSDVLWGATFSNINTASGIIMNGAKAGVDASLIAEAHFFRAWDYFMLVQTFGGVPLDLGSGELEFNQTPTTSSVRNTVPEVYAAIFKDLEQAVTDLPTVPRATGTVTKTVARLYLAKAYLTFAWWLENPNNIPTWPEAARTDVSESPKTSGQYFQLAYDTALKAIEEPGDKGLMDTFHDVNWWGNERNKEMLLYADHSDNQQFGGQSGDYGSPDAPFNGAVWFVTSQYDQLRAWTGEGDENWSFTPIPRSATQWGGRPWTRMAPPIEVFTETFADKTNDSRYDGTFAATYFGTWTQNNATVKGANNMDVPKGGALLKFLPADQITGTVTYPPAPQYKPDGGIVDGTGDNGKNNVGAGQMAGESAWVIELSKINRTIYPGLWKLGPARPDSEVGMVNYTNPRPYYIAKFSELYLIAAEAAVKGATGSMTARQLVNVLRERAGKWKHKNSEGIYDGSNGNYSADHSAAMVAATPATITIDYILDERSRELFGEGYRWYDLVRTQTWSARAAEYTIADQSVDGKPGRSDHAVKTFTRPIQPHHYLRPIPQRQFDRMEMSNADKQAYQNPGYTSVR